MQSHRPVLVGSLRNLNVCVEYADAHCIGFFAPRLTDQVHCVLLVREQEKLFGRTNRFYTCLFVNYGRTKKKGTKVIVESRLQERNESSRVSFVMSGTVTW
jgi:hypothetical protein